MDGFFARFMALAFDSDIKQLMGLFIHTLSSTEVIFVRGLFFYAPDEPGKLWYESRTDTGVIEAQPDFYFKAIFAVEHARTSAFATTPVPT